MKTINITRTAIIGSILFIAMCMSSISRAQSAFQAGEALQYNLYYNWQFIWVKAGSATMSIARTNYSGTPAYRSRLVMRGNSDADNYFVLRDTLCSHVSADHLQPLHYIKQDLEGSKHRKREVWYTYPNGKCHLQQCYTHDDGRIDRKEETTASQAYDMLSILLKARTFDPSQWKPGKRINFLMTDGRGAENQVLIYRGKEKIKMKDSSTTYRCLKLSFVEQQDGKEKEVVTFFVTDDANHIPVRLDMYLKFGAAKAFLVGTRGLKNPVTARVK